MGNKEKEVLSLEYSTDKISDVEAIGESAGGTVRRIINAIRRRIRTCSGGQVVVVAGVNQRVSKHEERPGCLGLRSNKSHSQNQAQRKHPKTIKDYWWDSHDREREVAEKICLGKTKERVTTVGKFKNDHKSYSKIFVEVKSIFNGTVVG